MKSSGNPLRGSYSPVVRQLTIAGGRLWHRQIWSSQEKWMFEEIEQNYINLMKSASYCWILVLEKKTSVQFCLSSSDEQFSRRTASRTAGSLQFAVPQFTEVSKSSSGIVAAIWRTWHIRYATTKKHVPLVGKWLTCKWLKSSKNLTLKHFGRRRIAVRTPLDNNAVS